VLGLAGEDHPRMEGTAARWDETDPPFDTIDVSEHHLVDFAMVRRQGIRTVIVRAGRGTRQDSRWIEHVRSAGTHGLATGSYWHVSPSHTDAHHQAELWAVATLTARSPFEAWHWADITADDHMDPIELGRYVTAFLHRADELFGGTVGLSTTIGFWRSRVGRELGCRPLWLSVPDLAELANRRPGACGPVLGARLRASDRGGPGWHRRFSAPPGRDVTAPVDRWQLDPRGTSESIDQWRARWLRRENVVDLQAFLNDLGADIAVDGTYGSETHAAVFTFVRLAARDLDPTEDQVPVDGDATMVRTSHGRSPARTHRS
jgi:hypothetical protein